MSHMSYDISQLKMMPRRHYGRMVSAALVLVVLAFIIRAFAIGKIEWSVVGQFLTVPAILHGIVNTLILTFCAMALGIMLGLTFALMRLSRNPVLSTAAIGYIWFFRAVPALLQLLIFYNLALVFPEISIPGLFSARTVDVMTPFVAALLALGIQQGAFTAEVIRAGLLSVDKGQLEAAQTIGMRHPLALRHIVIPQAMRVIIPPVGNEVISMVKLTSLASVIQYNELLHSAENIYYANSRVIELLIVATFWYIIIVTILSLVQMQIEKRFSRGVNR